MRLFVLLIFFSEVILPMYFVRLLCKQKKTREKSFPSNKIFSYDQNGKHMEKMICMTEMFSPNNDVIVINIDVK